MPKEHLTLHVTITGRVQGVGYRAWVEESARIRTLDGWVRNRRDGSVEALFAGAEKDVADMVDACKLGPESAKVAKVDSRDATADDLAVHDITDGFAVLPTKEG